MASKHCLKCNLNLPKLWSVNKMLRNLWATIFLKRKFIYRWVLTNLWKKLFSKHDDNRKSINVSLCKYTKIEQRTGMNDRSRHVNLNVVGFGFFPFGSFSKKFVTSLAGQPACFSRWDRSWPIRCAKFIYVFIWPWEVRKGKRKNALWVPSFAQYLTNIEILNINIFISNLLCMHY